VGFDLGSLNPFDQGHVLDLSGGGPGNTLHDVGGVLGVNDTPGQYQNAYQVNQGAFQNPAGSVAPQLGAALQSAPGQIQSASSPYVTGAGAGLGGLGQQYAAMAAGQGPSLATVQAQQQGAGNLMQAESMLGSARGAGSPGAAQLAAQRALTGGQQQVAQNAVQGRTAEEMQALGGMGSTYGALGGLGTTVTGQANDISGMNAQQHNAYLQALMQQNAQQQSGAMAGQQLGAGNALGYSQLQSGNYQQQQGRKSQLVGGLLQGGGGMLAAAL
jgi:hypothetical protein